MKAIMRRLLLAALPAAALMATGTAFAQIDNSKHDLATGTGDNGEICVYCHTPHGASDSIEAPLWNKPASGATYQTYDSTTIDGQILAVGSVSIACLSCHDGTQAMDTVINAPGSGGFNSAGARMNSLTGTGQMTAGIVANLGADLTNDHPIGVQYGGYDPGTGVIDPDFKSTAAQGFNSAIINGKTRWWVDTETTPNANRDKTDMILYTRDNGGNDQPFVECGSCHDPHSTANTPFLRVANAGSQVCLSCHVK